MSTTNTVLFLNPKKFPTIQLSLDTLVVNGGTPLGEVRKYIIPKIWKTRLPVIESAVSSLSNGERKDLLLGEFFVSQQVATRSSSLTTADDFFNSMFDRLDWEN